MIKHETITVSRTVLYCDGAGCRKRGPEAAYDNADDVLDSAHRSGWTQNNDGKDLCPKCSQGDQS